MAVAFNKWCDINVLAGMFSLVIPLLRFEFKLHDYLRWSSLKTRVELTCSPIDGVPT